MTAFPTLRLRVFLVIYKCLWIAFFPLALIYLAKRARRDRSYWSHLGERFGAHRPMPGAVWVHAVSLGELRSAVPLIRALLDLGDHVVTTHFTPAGRREATWVFAAEIAAGRLRVAWVPFEFRWCYNRFLSAFKPAYGLVMEIEIWPEMILSARRAGVPLFMCNAQYPSKSYDRDGTRTRWRADLMGGFAGAFVKSDLQRQRFARAGVSPIAVTGELRFDQPIPPGLVAQGLAAKATLSGRPVITIASAIAGEDQLYIDTILTVRRAYAELGLLPPLFVYVPRAPERFGEVGDMIAEAGLAVHRRSVAFDADLMPLTDIAASDVLLGDSLGEMYFYLALCDRAVVGGGYSPKGAHNIIEPLALQKPVIVGPSVWTIEFPATEAVAAGVCAIVPPDGLAQALGPDAPCPTSTEITEFFAAHSGSVPRTIAAIDSLIRS